MKKVLCASLAVLLAAGCSSSGGAASGKSDSMDLNYVFTSDPQTLDYMRSQNAADHEVNENLVDGLTEVNNINQYVGALADTWEHNEDSTEWTFTLKDGLQWVTNTGETYGDVTAQDFETGLQHAMDFDSPTGYIPRMFVKGLDDYYNGKADWDSVGVEAVDDKTIKYTLSEPTPYFASVVSYVPFYPINKDFLEEQGEGCKLGSPDVNSCDFGKVSDPSSILYNGGFILDSFTSKSSIKMHKNPAYYDADQVYVDNVNLVYDDGEDPNVTINGFEKDNFYQALLYTTSDDFDKYLEKYKDTAFHGQQDQYTFGVNFNMNRITYTTTDKNADQQADTREALLNSDFRNALKYGFDRVAYLQTSVDKSIAANGIRNIQCPWNFVYTSDGKSYGELVQEESADPSVDLSEGQDAYYNKDKAVEYLNKAKSELTDVSWPIKLDLMAQDKDKQSMNMASSLETSIESSLGSDNIDIVVHNVDDDTYQKSAYKSTGPVDADWDISTSTGWGMDYADPKTYLNIFSPINGDILRQNMGLEYYQSTDSTPQNDAAIEASGLLEYQDLLDEAYAINDDMDARYKAEAKAEAYLLDNALYIPVMTRIRSVNWTVSRETPFQRGYWSVKYKWMKINKDPITAKDYDKALKQWQKDMSEAAEKAAA